MPDVVILSAVIRMEFTCQDLKVSPCFINTNSPMVQLAPTSDVRGPAIDPKESTEEGDVGDECDNGHRYGSKPKNGLKACHFGRSGTGWVLRCDGVIEEERLLEERLPERARNVPRKFTMDSLRTDC